MTAAIWRATDDMRVAANAASVLRWPSGRRDPACSLSSL